MDTNAVAEVALIVSNHINRIRIKTGFEKIPVRIFRLHDGCFCVYYFDGTTPITYPVNSAGDVCLMGVWMDREKFRGSIGKKESPDIPI